MSITHLVELQDIDSQLDDLNGLLGDLPKMVEELNEQESRLISKLKEDKTRLKDINLSLKKSETANSEIQEKINKLTDQLFLVTNNKQYDALMLEIDHLKEQRATNETESIAFLEEKETLTESVESMESELGELSKNLRVRREKLETAISQSAEEKTSLEQQRNEQVNGIDLNIVSVYDRVMKARDGLAVVHLSNSACGGCGAHIPAQTITEVRAKIVMHRCDVCGRFLYNQEISVN